MSTVEQKKAQRDRCLKQLYDFSDGNVLRDVSYAVLARALDWDDDTSDRITAYLKNEGLIDFPVLYTQAGKTFSSGRMAEGDS
jgi:hypothetical protein